MAFLRKYATLTVTGTTAIRVPIVKRGVVDFAIGADWSPAAGDVKILLDGAAAANVTNLPTAVAGANTGAVWEFVLTAVELTGKQCQVVISDAATKAIEDQCFIVETFGNASAMYAADLSLANLPANVMQWLAGTIPAVSITGVPLVDLKSILGTALTETAGLLAGGFKKFFNIATPTGTVNSIPDAVAGAASGLALVGSNVGAATSVSGAVGSVTGNVGGNVVGSVASVTAGVTLAASAVQAIWDALTSALTTVGSIGKWIVDKIDVVLSTRLATSGYTAPPSAASNATAVRTELGVELARVDVAVSSRATPAQVNTEADAAITDAALATAANLAIAKTAIDAIKLQTDLLPSDPADESLVIAATNAIMTRLGVPVGADVTADIAAVLASVGLRLLASGYVTPPTAAAIADAVYDEDGGKLRAHLPSVLKAVLAAGSTTTSIVLNSTTGIDGAAPSSVDDFYNGCVLVLTSGALAGQRTSVSDYNGTTKTLTVVALTGSPVAAVTGILV